MTEVDNLKAKIKKLEEEIGVLKALQNKSAGDAEQSNSLFALATKSANLLDAGQQSFFTTILETLTEGVVACDNNYNFTLFNRAIETFTGRKQPAKHIKPEDWAEHFNLYYPETKQLMRMEDLPLYRALQGEHVRNVHLLIVPNGQEAVHCLVMGGPILNADGEQIGAVVITHNITALKEEEERLLKTKAELEDTVEERTNELSEANIYFSLSVDLFCIADFSGAFKRLNPAWEKTVGWTMDELQSHTWDYFVHPDDIAATMQEGEKVLHEKDIVACESRFLCKDGSYKWLLWSAKPILKKQLIYVVAHDITERKQNEEEIKRLNSNLEKQVNHLESANLELELLTSKLEQTRDQAVESSKLKSEFIANISHEIRTPLAGVIGMAELLNDTKLNGEQQALTDIMRESAHSLLTIISDILDFSKIEAGRIELEDEDFDLVSIVDTSIDLISVSAKQKQLVLQSTIDSQIPRHLQGDTLRIKQVLLNLLSNAIKFTEKGSITVNVTEQAREDAQITLRFAVEDTGIGLSEREQARLFEPFVQADGSTTREYGGTGLGLSICKRLVHLMGGTIGVNSKKGHGSTFWFTIASKISQATNIFPQAKTFLSQAEIPLPLKILDNAIVLLVEDNLILQDLVCRQLSKLGLNCQAVSNGTQAIEALRQNQYSLVLMDVQMPVMDGYQTARLIRQDEIASGKHIPIVAMTASALIGEEEKCLNAGMDGYLCKPVSLYDLSTTLVRWLPNQQQAQRTSQGSKLENEINELIALYGEEQAKQILYSFISEFQRLLKSLSEAGQAADKKMLATISHDLKGLCSIVPSEPILSICLELEQTVANPSWSLVASLQKQLSIALRQFQVEIDKNP